MVPPSSRSGSSSGRYVQLIFNEEVDDVPVPAILSSEIGIIPGGITDSRVGMDPQIFHCWAMLPRMAPLAGSVFHIRGEVPDEAQFQAAMVGPVPRTYINLGNWLGTAGHIPSNINTDVSVLWEG